MLKVEQEGERINKVLNEIETNLVHMKKKSLRYFILLKTYENRLMTIKKNFSPNKYLIMYPFVVFLGTWYLSTDLGVQPTYITRRPIFCDDSVTRLKFTWGRQCFIRLFLSLPYYSL